MTSLLEERYRRVLRWLPASYRRQWEEDMVATFLASAHAAAPDDPEGVDISSPRWPERASILALAVRLRLGGLDAPPRSLAWGEAVRRVALVGLLVYAASALASLAFMAAIAIAGPTAVDSPAPLETLTRWTALWRMTGLLWLPAYLSLVYGHRRVARILASLTFAANLVAAIVDAVGSGVGEHLSFWYGLAFQALPVVALVAFHSTAPPVRPRAWLVALPVGALALLGVLQVQLAVDRGLLLDWAGLWCVAVSVAAAGLLAGSAAGRGSKAPQWSLALAILGLAAFGLRMVSLSDLLTFAVRSPDWPTAVVFAVTEAVVVLTATVALAVHAGHIMRRLSPTA